MNKITHRRISVGFGYIVVALLYLYGMLKINYYEAFIIIVTISQVGARFPDYDHIWKNIADRDAVKFVINKIIQMTGGRHRSRHTHSIDVFIVTGICMYLINYLMFDTEVNLSVGLTIVTGFICGWASHLFADAMTMDGIYLFCWSSIKVRLVPKKLSRMAMFLISMVLISVGLTIRIVMLQSVGTIIGLIGLIVLIIGLRYGNMRFTTGDEWEQLVQQVMIVINIILGIGAFIFPMLLAIEEGINGVPDIINILTK